VRPFDIAPDTTIDLDRIEALVEQTPTTTRVVIEGHSYIANMSRQTLRSLMRSQSELPQAPRQEPTPVVDVNKFRTDPAW